MLLINTTKKHLNRGDNMQREIGKTFINILLLKDELKHGEEWEDHKYIVKVPTGISGGKKQYRYFYDMNEYKNYVEKLPLDELKKTFTMLDFKKYGGAELDAETQSLIGQILAETTEDDRSAITFFLTDVILKDSNQSKTVTDLNKKDRAYTPEEDWQVINEYYELDIAEHEAYTTNCASCTAAYDLRQRGYDVVAAGISWADDEPTTDELLSWYNGAEYVNYENNKNFEKAKNTLKDCRYTEDPTTKKELLEKAYKTIEEEFLKQGDGARGHFTIMWYPSGGHSIVYEVQNGKVNLKDCQVFEKSSLKDYITNYGDCINDISYIRTDNVEVNDNILDRVENRIGIDRNANLTRTSRNNRQNLNARTNTSRKSR